MPSIEDERDQLERAFIYVMCKFQLVWLMDMRIKIVLVKLVFPVEGFKMEQGAVIKYRVKLKKTAIETFEMLKSAYGEECLSRTSVFKWHKRFKEGRESLQDDEWKGHP
jgi:hypothetical protein